MDPATLSNRPGATVFVTILLLVGGFFVARAISKDEGIAASRKYCEDLIPRLEEYHQKNGRYPGSLGDLGSLPPRPSYLEEVGLAWNGATDTYRFAFQTSPSGFTLGYHLYFVPATREWKSEEGAFRP